MGKKTHSKYNYLGRGLLDKNKFTNNSVKCFFNAFVSSVDLTKQQLLHALALFMLNAIIKVTRFFFFFVKCIKIYVFLFPLRSCLFRLKRLCF